MQGIFPFLPASQTVSAVPCGSGAGKAFAAFGKKISIHDKGRGKEEATGQVEEDKELVADAMGLGLVDMGLVAEADCLGESGLYLDTAGYFGLWIWHLVYEMCRRSGLVGQLVAR